MAKRIKKTDRDKPWARKKIGSKPYQLRSKNIQKSFLIICEGQNTEPEYFKAFPVGNAIVQSYGLGMSKTKLVNTVIELIKPEADENGQELWVVFDLDVNPIELEQQKADFNQAIETARNNGLKPAYSVDAFELWFLLHYQDLATPWTRSEYYTRLSELWNCNYEKSAKRKEYCRAVYQKLQLDEKANQELALRRARDLLDRQTNLPPADQNPVTTVHKLVLELNQYL